MTEREPQSHGTAAPTAPDAPRSDTHAHDAGAAHGDSHGHGHPPHLAHHFDTPQQQYDSGKLGMWVFLATEILMFGGLFCAYAVYRGNHGPMFDYAHRFLDTNLGALNTVILIASSFTMAWAVRAAQLGQRQLLIALLGLTLAGGAGFMVVKAFEYNAKFSHHLGPGTTNLYRTPADTNPLFASEDNPHEAQLAEIRHLEEYYGLREGHGDHGDTHAGDTHAGDAHAADGTHAAGAHEAGGDHHGATDTDHAPATADAATVQLARHPAPPVDRSVIEPAPMGPAGLTDDVITGDAQADGHAAAGHGRYHLYEQLPAPEQKRVHLFFQIYYLMTGLHGLHVLIGMGLIGWILWRSALGHFGPDYFTPVDLVGLYWHLVDLIWIFLFPLLYLIH